jgi:acyl-CoA reductase-like NAD-dependent aldehyde dehydrogenase
MKMIIGGKCVDSSDKKVIEVYNPATGSIIDTIPAATEGDIKLAIEYAVEGQKEWETYPLWRRISILEKFKSLFLENREKLAHSFCSELGRIYSNSLDEMNWTAEMMTNYIEAARFFHGETLPVGNDTANENDLTITVREPIGVVVAIVPYNYPIELLMHKVVPSLLMGNSVIVKPASETPLTGIMFIELLHKAGIPGKALQVVTGSGSKVGKWLVDDERVAAVTFTGSTEVGQKISEYAAPHFQRILLELGGNDPFVVLEDADLEYAVSEALGSRLANAGQTCCSSKRLLIDNKIKVKFIEMLCSQLATKKIGDPFDPKTDCGPLVSEKAAYEMEEHLNIIIAAGGKLIRGGKRSGTYFEPTVIEVDRENPVAKDLEVFGPLYTIIGYSTVDEAIQIANNTKYGLSSGVCGKDMKTLLKVAKNIKAGGCIINGQSIYRTGYFAFGGYKHSGIGREGAICSFNELTESKNIVFKKCY